MLTSHRSEQIREIRMLIQIRYLNLELFVSNQNLSVLIVL